MGFDIIAYKKKAHILKRTFKAEVKKATMLLPMATTGTNCKPSRVYTSFCFFLPLLLFNWMPEHQEKREVYNIGPVCIN